MLSPHHRNNSPTGNRCNHNPATPQWDKIITPEIRGALPAILGDMLDNAIEYYYNPLTLSPLAKVMNPNPKRGAGKFRGTNQDGTTRRARSEAREAEVLVMVAILLHMDVVSLRIGTPTESNGFIHRSCRELAARVSMLDPVTKKPNRRFQRAFRRLQEAGLLTVTRVATKREDGKIVQTNAVKNVSEDFAVLLLGGTSEDRARLKRNRDGQSQKQAHRRAPSKKQAKAEQREQLGQRIEHNNRVNSAIKSVAADTGFKMTPDEYRAAYEQAKDAYAHDLRMAGCHFGEVVQKLREFPPLGEWLP